MSQIVDVSRHQGLIDWPRLRQEGRVVEAIIRCTMGSTGVDELYAQNWRESGWAGVSLRGAYHYVVTGVSAQAQVNNILRVTKGDFGNRPLVLDCERTSAERERMRLGWPFPKVSYTYTLREMIERLTPYTDIHIYTSAEEWKHVTNLPGWVSEFGLHVAYYSTRAIRPIIPYGWNTWEVWQYSSTGRLPGIAGSVDLNRRRNVMLPVTNPDVSKLLAYLDAMQASIDELRVILGS